MASTPRGLVLLSWTAWKSSFSVATRMALAKPDTAQVSSKSPSGGTRMRRRFRNGRSWFNLAGKPLNTSQSTKPWRAQHQSTTTSRCLLTRAWPQSKQGSLPQCHRQGGDAHAYRTHQDNAQDRRDVARTNPRGTDGVGLRADGLQEILEPKRCNSGQFSKPTFSLCRFLLSTFPLYNFPPPLQRKSQCTHVLPCAEFQVLILVFHDFRVILGNHLDWNSSRALREASRTLREASRTHRGASRGRLLFF